MNKPIRVLCVMSTLDRGGAESMVMSLFRCMDKDAVIFDFVKHTNKEGSFEAEIQRLGGKIYTAPRYRVVNSFEYIGWWRRFLKRHTEYTIIHGHFFTISSVYFSVAKKLGRKTVAHIHATKTSKEHVDRPFVHFLSNILINRIEKYSDYCMACSTEAGKWVFKKKPFTILKNAVDVDKFRLSSDKRTAIRRQLNVENQLILGTVANLSYVKNPMGLLDILIAVKKKNPNTKLIWVGEGEQRKKIEERIRREKLEDSVLLLGVRNDVQDILQAFDVFLLPSFNEGLPVSIIEAQAAGLPCFLSDRVTREADITGLCRFLPINNPIIWSTEILENQIQRRDTKELIIKAGYDICATAQWLQKFYESIERNEQYRKL